MFLVNAKYEWDSNTKLEHCVCGASGTRLRKNALHFLLFFTIHHRTNLNTEIFTVLAIFQPDESGRKLQKEFLYYCSAACFGKNHSAKDVNNAMFQE